MKLDQMNEFLENKGFAVRRVYQPNEGSYGFYINNSELSTYVGYDVFKYPKTKDKEVKDERQRMFLEDLIANYYIAIGRVPKNQTKVDFDEIFKYYKNDVESTKKVCENMKFAIKNVIFNNPATIVFWMDGTKTVVKCQEDDIFDPEKGLAMAISKKALGNKGNYCNQIKKWTEKYHEKHSFYYSDEWKKIREAFLKAFGLMETSDD